MVASWLSRNHDVDGSRSLAARRSTDRLTRLSLDHRAGLELRYRPSRNRGTWIRPHRSLCLGRGLPSRIWRSVGNSGKENPGVGPRCAHKIICRYRADHGEGLGTTGRSRLDRKTFQSRVSGTWFLVIVRGNSYHARAPP